MVKLLLTFCLAFAVTGARAEFQVPPLTGPVIDLTGRLSADTKIRLERKLMRLHESGGSQLQVVVLPNLGGLSIEEAGIKMADEWKIGRAKSDDGIILIFAMSERRVRIEVGKGREGDLHDITANRIIHEVIVPRMRAGQLDRAVEDGARAILHYSDRSQPRGQEDPSEAEPPNYENMAYMYFLFLFVMLMLLLWLPKVMGARGYRRWGGGPFDGFGGGGFGGGGFGGGGGWSGGGGGFSGGGSSGSW